MPDMPRELKGEAAKEWKRIAPDLERDGRVSHLDQQMIAAYCRAISMAMTAADDVQERGILIKTKNGIVKNPALQVFRDCMATATAVAKPLGITPRGRADLKIEPQEPEPEGDSYFND
jgi:P27 family predicted phage terminase small subunit